jgi:predicted lactoylglutathione lyase
MMEADTFIAWGEPGGGAGLGLTKPFDGNPATVGNGAMAALLCKDAAQVDAVHELALSLGARDEGAPGPRPGPPGFYAAYFRDPDGNKLNVHVMPPKQGHLVGYVTLGSNDLARAGDFYDAIVEPIGARRIFETPTSIVWSTPSGSDLDLTKPHDGRPAAVGNGVMVALQCADKAQVDRIHEIAMSLGAKDEGGPGDRGSGFYAAYFRDPDGNKLNAFVMA